MSVENWTEDKLKINLNHTTCINHVQVTDKFKLKVKRTRPFSLDRKSYSFGMGDKKIADKWFRREFWNVTIKSFKNELESKKFSCSINSTINSNKIKQKWPKIVELNWKSLQFFELEKSVTKANLWICIIFF